MIASTPLGRVVFVLGMHRSGTSCLTGCLEECGLVLGDVNREAPHNKKGNQENVRIMALHDDLLSYNGGSWDRPPAKVVWSHEHRRRRDLILAEYQGSSTFGIKDPRTLLALDGWLETGIDTRFVGTFRHPRAVARSLNRRNGFSTSQAVALWTEYNRILSRKREELEFDLVCFDAPEQEYLRSVIRVAPGLGLEPPKDETGFEFFDSHLRSEAFAEEEISPQALDLYEHLESSCRGVRLA